MGRRNDEDYFKILNISVNPRGISSNELSQGGLYDNLSCIGQGLKFAVRLL